MKSAQRSILWALVVPLPLLLVASLAVAWVLIPRSILDNAREAAVQSGVATVNQFKTIRKYYTENVVNKAVNSGALAPSINHRNEPDSIPLPATLVHDLSELLAEEDTTINLYSGFPFPNRAGRVLDDFQRGAWAFLSDNPDQIYTRQEVRDGRETVRVAVADRMVAEVCVSCHNNHPDSPKTDWSLGDVRGVLEVNTAIDAQIAASDSLSNRVVLGAALVGVILVLVCVFVGRRIVRPIKSMTQAMLRLAEGDTTGAVPDLERADEIGAMAGAVQVFKENAVEKQRLEVEQEEAQKRAEAEQRQAMLQLADSFEESVKGIVDGVSSAATEMQSTAEAVSHTADQTRSRAMTVASAAEEASSNVQTVASASEELAGSIQEIGRQVAQSSKMASEAAEQAEQTNGQVEGLVEAAQKIGEVVTLIQDIAEQTNLLALNATIEAARAGEAGKGFAVVASEVKSLATQTAKATEDISQQISGIQGATTGAAEAIRSIAKTVSEINGIATTIASAVEEQGSATQEIARNVQEASTGTQEVSTNIAGVTTAVDETGQSAAHMLSASGDLAKQARTLSDQVEVFLAKVRAA
jgi:methyl-accepting chemotaxis protein